MDEQERLAPTFVTPDAAPAMPYFASDDASGSLTLEARKRADRPQSPRPPPCDRAGLSVPGLDPGLALPSVGSTFLGFRLIALLGRGAFGQVYLAEQGDLANRYVTLKVARDIFGESQTLAQLQHTHIVPIFSVHRTDAFQAVCMPYCGATTLADVLDQAQLKGARPASGKVLVDTINQRKGALAPLLKSASARPASVLLQRLERMTYVEAILWVGERIADGLAHAHEHGILHHDVKPANILLTEDGLPMLLDFNISEDTKRRIGAANAMAGGTLPYMAPEHLEVSRDPDRLVDARSDIYSLGVILYEMLGGARPFKTHTHVSGDTLDDMIDERRKPVPPLRAANPAVSPAIASIVSRCLEPDPARRYGSARELQEDLRRQRCDLPLRHAKEPSLRERARKWVRRHPRLASITSVVAMLGVVLAALGSAFVVRGQQLGRLQAQETLRLFRDDAKTVQFLLYSRHADRARLEEGMTRSRGVLAHFGVLDNPAWQQTPAVRYLPEQDQAQLREEAGEVLFLLARASALHAQTYGSPDARDGKLDEALALNRLAEASFGAGNTPAALWEQRADLTRLRGDPRQAAELAAQAKLVPIRTPRDRYLIGHQQAIRGNLREALDTLRRVTQDDPRNFSAWFVRGNCCYDLLQDGNAVACFNACVTLRPKVHWTWFNRGLAHLRLREFRQAVDDFDRALELQQDLTDAYVSRGMAREGMQAYREAIADYTIALTDPNASTRIYFLRAAARTKVGDGNGAQRDYDQGLATEPNDELSWIARGLARRDPRDALADFERALQINPRSFDGLQNKAALLSDKFRNDAEALEVMEQAVKLYPESVLTRGGRGVLLARAGRRAPAVEDAQACLLLDAGPSTQYQAACIYALTAKQTPADRLQALPLLSAALRAGFGLEFVDHDTDLDPLRNLLEFRGLVAAARALHARPLPAAPPR